MIHLFDFHTIKNNSSKINIEWTAAVDFPCGTDHSAMHCGPKPIYHFVNKKIITISYNM